MVPREPEIKDLLRKVRESLSITVVLIYPRRITRTWLGEEKRKVRGRESTHWGELCAGRIQGLLLGI